MHDQWDIQSRYLAFSEILNNNKRISDSLTNPVYNVLRTRALTTVQ